MTSISKTKRPRIYTRSDGVTVYDYNVEVPAKKSKRAKATQTTSKS